MLSGISSYPQRKACQVRSHLPGQRSCGRPGTLTRRELDRPVIWFHSKTYPSENTRVATTVPFGHYRWHRIAAFCPLRGRLANIVPSSDESLKVRRGPIRSLPRGSVSAGSAQRWQLAAAAGFTASFGLDTYRFNQAVGSAAFSCEVVSK